MQTTESTSQPSDEDRRQRGRYRRRRRALATSAVLCVLLSACYWWQPDWLAPVTLVPAWCWLLPALALTAYGISRRHPLLSLLVLVFWGAFVAGLVDEARSLLRSRSRPTAEWLAARQRGRGIRVVSLNCAAGDRQAAAEAATWEPDILLLQESPSEESLAHLARELFGAEGAYLHGGDTSIVARGRIQPRAVDRSSHFVHAIIELPTGLRVEAISARLDPPVFRLDFWRRSFWVEHRNNRICHRRQILDIMQQLEEIPQSTPVIVGGDFNAPPRDAALLPLRHRLFDTFRMAGCGWGNTGTNRCPLFRVDQIWASRQFRAESVTAEKTARSDHRMVVCDLILE